MGKTSAASRKASHAAEKLHEKRDEAKSRKIIDENIEKLKRRKGQFVTKEEVRC